MAFNSGNIHVFFPAMLYPRHRFYKGPSLLSEVAAFGACCFRRFAILGEQKNAIQSWYDCHMDEFSVLDPVIFHNSSCHKQYPPLLQCKFYQSTKQKKGLEKCSKHL